MSRLAPRPRVALGALIALVALVAAPLPPGHAASRDDDAEYRVKAAFLFNFARFVEWSDHDDDVMRICLLPPDPFGEVLDRTVAGKRAHGRPFEVVRIAGTDDLAGCDMLFVGAAGAKLQADAIEATNGAGVLTVGDDPPFAARGGVINFVVTDGRVGFEINRHAASRRGLHISSKLLGLARIVDERTDAERPR